MLKQEIVCQPETCFALADQLELRLAKARGQVDQLTPSLLARAFSGKLVPQDPNDEPASALLERIRKVGRSISEMATVSDDETPSKTGRILWLRPFTSRKVRGVVSVRGEPSGAVGVYGRFELGIAPIALPVGMSDDLGV